MKQQSEINIILHYPRTILGIHHMVRHAVAVKELIDQDIASTLDGPLSANVQLLNTEQEEAALERYMRNLPCLK